MSDTLREILSEVDRLEKELKDLDREVQKEQGGVHHLNQLIKRDEDHIINTNKDMAEHNVDIKQWIEREKSLSSAIDSCTQSKQLLSQMAAQSSSTLEIERMITTQHKRELRGKLETFKMKVEKEDGEMMRLPQYRQLIELEELTDTKRKYMASLIKGGKNCDSRSIIRNQSVKLAEVWLDVNEKSENLSLAEEEKLKIQDEITQALSVNYLNREETLMELGDELRQVHHQDRDCRIEDFSQSMNVDPIQLDQATNVESGCINDEHKERGYIDEANDQRLLVETNILRSEESSFKMHHEPAVGRLPRILPKRSEIPNFAKIGKDTPNNLSKPMKLSQIITSKSDQKSSSSSVEKSFTIPSKPVQSFQKPQHSDVIYKQSTKHLTLFQPPTPTERLSSYKPPNPTKHISSCLPPTPTKHLSSYVPPTPKTKMLHLKLCSSLLGSSKKKEVNTILVSDGENNKKLEILGTSSELREVDNSGDQSAGQRSGILLDENLNRANPNKPVWSLTNEGNNREKKEITDRFDHSSGKTMESTEDVEMSDVGTKKFFVTPEVHPSTHTNNSTFNQRTIDSVSVKQNPVKEKVLLTSRSGLLLGRLQPSKQKKYSVQSVKHQSEVSKSSISKNMDTIVSETNTSQKIVQVSAAPIVAVISEPPESIPIGTPPTIKKLPSTTMMSVSPGTALCPEKRNRVLQQLLESPVPVPRVQNHLLQSPMPVPSEDDLFQQSPLPVPKVVKKKSQLLSMPLSNLNSCVEKISLPSNNFQCYQSPVTEPQKNNQYLAGPESGSKNIKSHCLESSRSVLQEISHCQESSRPDPEINRSVIERGKPREEIKSDMTKDKSDGSNFFNTSSFSGNKNENNNPGNKNMGCSAFSFFGQNETDSTEASFSLFGDAEEENDETESEGFDFNFGSSFGIDKSNGGGSFF